MWGFFSRSQVEGSSRKHQEDHSGEESRNQEDQRQQSGKSLISTQRRNGLYWKLNALRSLSFFFFFFLWFPTNRKRGCGRRKLACHPVERNGAAEEETSGGDQNMCRLHLSCSFPPASTTTTNLPFSRMDSQWKPFTTRTAVSLPYYNSTRHPPPAPPSPTPTSTLHHPHIELRLSAEQIRSRACSEGCMADTAPSDESLKGQRSISFIQRGVTSERPACERSQGVSGSASWHVHQWFLVRSHFLFWTVDVTSDSRMMKLLHILSVKMYQIELPEGKMPPSLCGNSVKEKKKKKKQFPVSVLL